jgi:hypothetical protein
MLDSEALSARDIARLYADLLTERDARRLLLASVRAGQTGRVVDGGPLKVHGTWLATLSWWREALLPGRGGKE